MRKLGIVGIRGGLERALMTADHGGVDIVAACDTAADRRDMAAQEGIAVYDDYDAMLAKADLDAVIVDTPNHLHCEMTLKAYERGLDVFVEKPMATTLADCDRMIEGARAAGKLLMVGLCYRYSNLYRALAERIGRQVVGPARLIWCKEFRGFWGSARDEWRLSQAMSGGAMVEKNCHHFDIFNWVVGAAPVRVQAFGGNAVHTDSETIDHAMVNVEYANGVKGTLMLSLFVEQFSLLEFGVVCDRGKVETLCQHGEPGEDASTEDAARTRSTATTLSVWPVPGVESTEIVAPTYSPRWPDGAHQHLGTARQFEVFNACLTQGASPDVDGAIGRESLLIPIAAEKSIQLGGQVVEITGRDL